MPLVQPIPKPAFKRKRMVTRFPPEVEAEIRERAGGLCEGKDCPNRRGDFRGLELAHRFKEWPPNKGMGGTKRVPTAEEGWLACARCHNLEDHHRREA